MLNIAGDLRRSAKQIEVNKTKDFELIFEQKILLKAILSSNEPKLTSSD